MGSLLLTSRHWQLVGPKPGRHCSSRLQWTSPVKPFILGCSNLRPLPCLSSLKQPSWPDGDCTSSTTCSDHLSMIRGLAVSSSPCSNSPSKMSLLPGQFQRPCCAICQNIKRYISTFGPTEY